MLLFTWNLMKSEDAFDCALDYLHGNNHGFIAAFQELPSSLSSTREAEQRIVDRGARGVHCLGVRGSESTPGRIGLFASLNVAAEEALSVDARARMAMISVKVGGHLSLSIIGIHALDRRNVANEFGRGIWARELRQTIDEFCPDERPMVIMGDFNADPYDPEIGAREALFAIRDRAELKRKLRSHPSRPLYNPMWSLLPESDTRPRGTFLLKGDPYRGIRWRLCDQIIVSRELVESIQGPPEILSDIGATKLANRNGLPVKTVSDHFPVQMRITI